MNILIAPDSFKESLSAGAVADALEAGFKKILPDARYVKIPMADGGEGTVQSLIDATQGRLKTVAVTAPLGNTVEAGFGISGDGKTAVIEMAAASGLHLVAPEQRNPLLTTSYGTGELILAALDEGVEKIILGIGGSATNDGGAGMLQALGVSFTNKFGKEIPFGGGNLHQITQADFSRLDSRLQHTQIEVACDVDNPLCGEKGAAAVFGPQKGATPQIVAELDSALEHFADIIADCCETDIRNHAGAGAAGGMGGGLLTLPNVRLQSGIQIVMETVNLAAHIRKADLVITGEGRMDAQSIHGKTPVGVAQTAKQYGKPVIAVVGCLHEDYEVVYEHGIDAVFPIIRQTAPLEQVLANARENLISTAQNIARVMTLSR
ncbi:glycerate kinase [Neisseria sp. ZJ106]|uniref:Glycerate kinase n=1 Tax=Neisseria lisongii TaxID=2912188 RepID=A0ABY7RLA8_9NEIS|nr:glycerate kinase [Neisseria lisongii]MCF7521090.1 glycerate kinase [Neisseria lisongii]WCL72409.1 glycerate kinase [Neisseria lisongii]